MGPKGRGISWDTVLAKSRDRGGQHLVRNARRKWPLDTSAPSPKPTAAGQLLTASGHPPDQACARASARGLLGPGKPEERQRELPSVPSATRSPWRSA